MKRDQIVGRKQLLQFLRGLLCRLLHDCDFVILRKVVNHDVEHEAVKLGFVTEEQFDAIVRPEQMIGPKA